MTIDLPPEVMVMIAAALIEPYNLQVHICPQTDQVEIRPEIQSAKETNSNLAKDSILSMNFLTVSKGFLSVVTTALHSRFTGITCIKHNALNLIHSHTFRSSLIWSPNLVTEIRLERISDRRPLHLNLNLYPILKRLTINLPVLQSINRDRYLTSRTENHRVPTIVGRTIWRNVLKPSVWEDLGAIAATATSPTKVAVTVDFRVFCPTTWTMHQFRADVGVLRSGELMVFHPDRDGFPDAPCLAQWQREVMRQLRDLSSDEEPERRRMRFVEHRI